MQPSTSATATEGIDVTAKTEHLNVATPVTDGEKDVDEEAMFQENDIDHSIQQKSAASSGISAGIGLALSPSTSTAANSDTLQKLDNAEALKRIQNQLNEMKILTSNTNAKTNASSRSSSGTTQQVSTINTANTDEVEELINVCANIQPIPSNSKASVSNGVIDKIKKMSKIKSNFYQFVSKRARI